MSYVTRLYENVAKCVYILSSYSVIKLSKSKMGSISANESYFKRVPTDTSMRFKKVQQ